MALDPLAYQVHDEPPASSLALVDAGLDKANHAAAPLADVRPLASFAHARGGRLVAGAVGRTWGQCCELQQLWVEPDHRRQGVASRLLQLFEARAADRGCRYFYLETFSFQAPGFYQKQGYRSAIQLDGFSAGITKQLMVKRLDRN